MSPCAAQACPGFRTRISPVPMTRPIPITALLLALSAAAVPGCAWIDEIGEVESRADFTLSSAGASDAEYFADAVACILRQTPVSFTDFDADEPIEDRPRIRMYESIEESLRTNYALVTFSDYDYASKAPCPKPDTYAGMTVDVTPAGCVQVQFQFNRCDMHPTARFVGTMTFTKFSLARGKRTAGTLSGTLEYVEQIHSQSDTVERATTIANIDGTFDYVNHVGAVWNR